MSTKDIARKSLKLLDKKFFDFVSSLPEPLSSIATKKSTYLGQNCNEGKFVSIYEIFGYFTLIPCYFKENFNIQDEALKTILIGNTFLALHIFLIDHIFDSEIDDKKHTSLHFLALSLYYESLKYFFSLFSPQSIFWSYYKEYFYQYQDAITKEKEAICRTISVTDYLEISKNRASFLKLGLSAIAIHADRKDLILSLNKSIEYYSVALHLIDDANDWRDDLLSNRPSYLSIDASDYAIQNDLTEDIENIIISSRMESVYEVSNEYFKNALMSVTNIKCDDWKKHLHEFINENCTVIYQIMKAKFNISQRYVNKSSTN